MKPRRPVAARAGHARGLAAFSLVEVVLALGIVAFALIALMGLLPIALTSNRDSEEEGGAVNLLSAIVADYNSSVRTTAAASSPAAIPALTPLLKLANPLQVTTPSNGDYFFDDAEQLLPNDAGARYRVQVSYYAKTSAVGVSIRVVWPPSPGAKGTSRVETFLTLLKPA